ncbi:complement C1q subcomponent subunit A-like [Saccostrea echinata]|uniref:complement C1q subcomponent subunit A-like n=1 Tax=Saccostrea echinata TaxID=191078 RepID=UPI002A7F6857|nr:complement C1q subcomponent subunit A-like [Saccostrea echinata]
MASYLLCLVNFVVVYTCICITHCLLLNDPLVVEQRLARMESLVEGLSQEVTALRSENTDLKSKITSETRTPVYFSAYRKNSLTLTSPSKVDVVYDVVRSNFHNCYNPTTGHFTAPMKGFYVFSWETSTAAGKIFDTELLVNGTRHQLNYCNNLATTAAFSSCTGVVPIQLEAGDVVNIRSTVGTYCHGSGWSIFSGWLVFEM